MQSASLNVTCHIAYDSNYRRGFRHNNYLAYDEYKEAKMGDNYLNMLQSK